jgi:NAD(P)-dependent dehydrogenase (short-subunit alcohol dehydrogenase family)
MKTDLEGRVAVVTGAGRGIGRAVALALAHAGAKVAALARTRSEIEETAALIKKFGAAQAFEVDVTDTSGVRRAMEKIEADYLWFLDVISPLHQWPSGVLRRPGVLSVIGILRQPKNPTACNESRSGASCFAMRWHL